VTPAPRAPGKPFRSQATRVGWLRAHRPRIRQFSWLLLAAPLLAIVVSDGLGEQPTPADAAPAVAALPADAAAAPMHDAVAIQGPPVPEGPPVRLPAPGPLDGAETARRIGDYDRAASMLRELANGQDKRVANDALLQLAVVQIEAGRHQAAADAASELMGRPLDPSGRASALFLLGRARRAANECQGAVAAFDEAARTAPDFGPYADLQAAYCLAALNDRAGQNARGGKAAEAAQARLTKLDGLEHQVAAALKLGDTDGAIRASEALLAGAGTPTYRAQTLTSLGTIAKDADRRDQAVTSFATVVAELPETPSAIGALDALRGMNAANVVAPDEASAALFFAGRYSEAIPQLRGALEAGLSAERAARARFYLGQALLRLDAVDEGVAVLRQVADDLPGSDLAARAFLRAGRRLEVAGRLEGASELYGLASQVLPSSPAAQEANARLVFTLMLRGAAPQALAAAQALAEGGADGKAKGLGLLWASKSLAKVGDRAQANALLNRAAELDADGYGGLRARAILEGDTRGGQGPADLDLSRLQPSSDDVASLEGWLKGRGIDSATLEREQASEPGYQRAALLYRIGMPEWASWELQDLAARWEFDPARLYGLARYAAERGDTTLGMRFALAAQKAAGSTVAALPRPLQRLIYPLPYADTIAAQAKQRGVDPLLFAGLIRQESTFNPMARSSANALGLAQVVPTTGQGIANALGRGSFKSDDLYRPNVAIEFGVYYLGRQLSQYDGRVFPALAAYNAGGGTVNGWLAQFGADDPDLFAEQIPYAETSHYLQVVYENYLNYRRLYR
jgi:soluble lytic murein transglycosylase